MSSLPLVGDVHDFVGEYFFLIFLSSVALVVTSLAWKLSGRPTLAYHVHLIQTYQSESHQIVQITNVDPDRVHTSELPALISEQQDPEAPAPSQNRRVRALVVHSPSSTRPTEENYFCPETTTIRLPLGAERHIAQVYESLTYYTDPSIAGAIVVSLHRHIARRLSSQNLLLISRLLSEIGGAPETDSPTVETTSDSNSTTMSASGDNNTPSEADASSTAQNTTDQSADALLSSNENASASSGLPGEIPTSEGVGDHTVRLKFLDDTERVVKTSLSSTVIEFKKAHFAAQVAAGKTIRLIFRGQLLRDDNRSLESYGLQDNCIVHCHINNKPYIQGSSQASSANNAGAAGDRPNASQIPPRPVFDEVPNESWLMRCVRLSVYYADAIPFMLFYAFSSTLLWVRDVENVRDDPNAPLLHRAVTRFRRSLFSALRIFIDFNEQPQNLDPEDLFSNRFNLGILFTLLFAVKFMSIWFVVLYFPQYTDAKGVFMLLVLTIFFGMYTFHNRPNATPPRVANNLPVNAEGFAH